MIEAILRQYNFSSIMSSFLISVRLSVVQTGISVIIVGGFCMRVIVVVRRQ